MSTAPQPDNEPPEPTRLKINSSRLLAGTLAAVTGAALSSRLGVAGTLAGTAFISLVSGMAATVYEHSVERGKAAMRNRLSALEENGGRNRIRLPHAADAQRDHTAKLPESGTEPGRVRTALSTLVHQPGRRWALAGAGALGTFVLALGIVTTIELAHGSSLSGTGHQTTLGQAFTQQHHNSPPDRRQPTTPSSSSTPTSSPTGTPSPSQPPSSAGTPSGTPAPSTSSPPSATTSAPSTTPSPSTTTAPPTSPSTTPPPSDTQTTEAPPSNVPSTESSR